MSFIKIHILLTDMTLYVTISSMWAWTMPSEDLMGSFCNVVIEDNDQTVRMLVTLRSYFAIYIKLLYQTLPEYYKVTILYASNFVPSSDEQISTK